MNSLNQQLVHAYRQEEKLYLRVRDLIEELSRVMKSSPDPRTILRLCGGVERLMGEIAIIEGAIEPAKRLWTETKQVDAELDGVLAGIQATIEQTAGTQQKVQRKLLDYMQRHKATANSARAQVSAGRARALYGSR